MLRDHQTLFSDRYQLPYNKQSKLDPMSEEWKQDIQATLKQELILRGNITSGEVQCKPTVSQKLTSYNDIILACMLFFVFFLTIFFVIFLKRQKVLCFEEECTQPVDRRTNRGESHEYFHRTVQVLPQKGVLQFR